MPLFARPVTDERDSLLIFLAQQRAALRASVLGLTDEQTRATPAASGLSLGGLIKHAARTERRWVIAGIAGQPLPGLWPIENWPMICTTSSPAIRLRQANAQPCFIPAT